MVNTIALIVHESVVVDMVKVTFETKDFLSLEPHEWKKIQNNPTIYEALKEGIFQKCHDYEKEGNFGTQTLNRIEFKKGDRVEVKAEGDKFLLTYDDDLKTPFSITTETRIEKE